MLSASPKRRSLLEELPLLELLRQFYPVVLAGMLLTYLVSYGYYRLTPREYEASLQVKYLQKTPVNRFLSAFQAFLSTPNDVKDQLEVVRSQRVIRNALKSLGLFPPGSSETEILQRCAQLQARLRADFQTVNSNVIRLTLRAETPELVRDVLNAVVRAYCEEDMKIRQREEESERIYAEEQAARYEERLTRKRSLQEDLQRFEARRAQMRQRAEELAQVFARFDEALREQKMARQKMPGAKEIHPAVKALLETSRLLTQLRDDPADEDALIARYGRGPEPVRKMLPEKLRLVQLHRERARLQQEVDELRRELGEKLGGENRVNQSWFSQEMAMEEEKLKVFRTAISNLELTLKSLTSNVVVLSEALLPEAPVYPKPRGVFGVATVVGLFLNLLLLTLLQYHRAAGENPEDLKENCGLDIMGIIPRIEQGDSRPGKGGKTPGTGEDPILCRANGRSRCSDAYRILLTTIASKLPRRPVSLLVTSSTMQEGKSTTVANLGIACAELGHRTLLVGGNLRRPTLYKIFRVPQEGGISDLLEREGDRQDWRHYVKETSVPNLDLLTSGKLPRDSTRFFSTPRFGEVVAEMKQAYDYVIIDCPPTTMVTDAMLMAPQVDGVLLVYASRATDQEVLIRAKDMLLKNGANLLGIVINEKMKLSGYYKPKYYYYGYGKEAVAKQDPASEST